jgi:hypothetical protein
MEEPMNNFRSTVAIALLVALMVAGVLWGSAVTQSGVERAVRQNFVAAGLLSRLQVEGEKMRRYEKEMFIYVADPAKREGYVKEYEAAYTKMLTLLDSMLLPSSPYFTDAERTEVLRWKEAALFYAGDFANLSRKAATLQPATLSMEQRVGLTVDYNNAIKAGKDRFRELLAGTDKMRVAKEEAAQNIATEIDGTFFQLRAGVLAGGLVAIGLMLVMLRGGRAGAAAPQLAEASARQR